MGGAVDAIWTVFNPEVIDLLWKIKRPTPLQSWRRQVLTCEGRLPENPYDVHDKLRLRSDLAAWEAYIEAARFVGMLDGIEGKKIRRELQGVDDDGFRSAMAECLVAWFLAGRCGFSASPWPPGRKGKVLDFRVQAGAFDFDAEVKAPFRPIPEGGWWGDDADVLEKCLETANRQFDTERPNVLVLVPQLRTPVFEKRYQLISAFFGKAKLVWDWNPRTGAASSAAREEFFQEGSFLRVWGKGEGRRFTRVGAVISIEPTTVFHRTPGGEPKWWVDHHVFVAHNPAGVRPIPHSVWEGWPQFIHEGGRLFWTDQHPLHD